jgi:hypothetical protein
VVLMTNQGPAAPTEGDQQDGIAVIRAAVDSC